jgi:hypothetical protein
MLQELLKVEEIEELKKYLDNATFKKAFPLLSNNKELTQNNKELTQNNKDFTQNNKNDKDDTDNKNNKNNKDNRDNKNNKNNKNNKDFIEQIKDILNLPKYERMQTIGKRLSEEGDIPLDEVFINNRRQYYRQKDLSTQQPINKNIGRANEEGCSINKNKQDKEEQSAYKNKQPVNRQEQENIKILLINK